MKIKVLGLVLSLTIALLGVLLWQTDQFSYDQSMKSLEKQLRQQSILYESRFHDKVSQYQTALLLALRSGSLQAGEWSLLDPFQQVLVLEQFGTRFSQKQVYERGQLGLNPTAISAFIAQANLEFEKTPTAKYLVIPFKDMNRSYTGVVFLLGAQAYSLIGPGAAFGLHDQIFQYPVGVVELFTKNQFVVSDQDEAYLGSVRSEDRPSQVALQSAHSRGLVKYEAAGGQYLAFFSRISESNVILISKENLSSIMSQSRFASLLTALFIGSFAILLFGALYYLYNRFIRNLNLVEAKISSMIQGQKFAVKGVQLESELSAIWGLLDSLKLGASKGESPMLPVEAKMPGPSDQDKMESFKKVASSLVHEFRGPLASIIGFAQMILNKKPELEIQNHTSSILREVRYAHDILEKLNVFSGESTAPAKETDLTTPLLRAMNNLDQTLRDKGIQVHRKLTSQSKMFMNLPAMQLAFENILKNSIEAMDRMPEKEMTISLTEDSEAYHFEFTDSGEGMDQQQLEKALDPFFTTRSFQNHVGLGLSLAAGVVREHGGQLQIESKKGQGTKVMIQIPKVNPIKQPQTETLLKAPASEKVLETSEQPSALSQPALQPKESARPAAGSSVLDHLPEPDLDILEDLVAAPDQALGLHKAEENKLAEPVKASEKVEIDLPHLKKKATRTKEIDSMEVKIRGPKPRSI